MSEPMIISPNALSAVLYKIIAEEKRAKHKDTQSLFVLLAGIPDDTYHRFAELLSEAAQSRIEQTPTMIRRPGKADFSGWEGKE